MNDNKQIEEKAIEEMAKILNECCNEYDEQGNHLGNKCASCECWSNTNHVCVSYNTKEAEALYNAGYRRQEWISVEERLPETNRDCLLLLDTEEIVIGYCRRDLHAFVEGGIVLVKDVTHWMPLPEPPKGGAE